MVLFEPWRLIPGGGRLLAIATSLGEIGFLYWSRMGPRGPIPCGPWPGIGGASSSATRPTGALFPGPVLPLLTDGLRGFRGALSSRLDLSLFVVSKEANCGTLSTAVVPDIGGGLSALGSWSVINLVCWELA